MKHLFILSFLTVHLSLYALASIPPGYYDQADGKKKVELKTAIHEIISHANVLNYGSGAGATWSGFYKTDLLPNNQVRDRYSNEIFYFTNATSAPAGMNIEHAFPKSWWGGSTVQAYKDIHHLMPCQISINSSKSNYPMGEVTEVKVNNGVTKVGKGLGAQNKKINLWEPADNWKGDFARVYLYMSTCYQDYNWSGTEALSLLEKNEWPTLQPWAYKLYLQWCKEDPVDEIERLRNEEVYQIQGNRNPFIDFPSLAEYIWGDSIDYAFSVSGGTTEEPENPSLPDEELHILLNESFVSSVGDFLVVDHYGANSTMWKHSAGFDCMLANAFAVGKLANDWLISPEIDLTGSQKVVFTFEHATGYHQTNSVDGLFKVKVSENFSSVPSLATWVTLSPKYPSQGESSFTPFVSSDELDLSTFSGKKIRIAFQYSANASQCYAWEIKNILIKAIKYTDGIVKTPIQTQEVTDAVYTINGTYVGKEIPKAAGIYILKTKKSSKTVFIP